MADILYHEAGEGLNLAYRHRAGRAPTLIFLPGYASDMDGAKAVALDAWAAREGRAMLRFDYAGCGQSAGDFETETLIGWRGDVLAMIDEVAAEGPVVLVGSSMGGWLMLLCALELGERLAALVGIAAAPDFTDWGYTDEQKTRLAAGESVFERNPYSAEPLPTHARFWQDGEARRLLGGEIALTCPVRLLHGQRDADVPHEISLRIAAALRSDDVQVTLIKDGDHRLSRDPDLALMLRTIAELS